MLGRSLEIKGREAAGFSSNWGSLELSHILSNITRILWSPRTKGGRVVQPHQGMFVCTPSVLAALHLLHKPLHVANKPTNRFPQAGTDFEPWFSPP